MPKSGFKEQNVNLHGVTIHGDQASTLDSPNRRAVRSVVLDQSGNVALLYVQKHGYHKLPGGV